jgi:hypothetical protein
MARTTAGEWAKRVTKWKASGMTASAFGEEEGVDPHQLSWWKWKLNRDGARCPATITTSMFLPARVIDAPLGAHDGALTAGSPIDITLPSGVRVRVLPGVDSGALRQVFAALEDIGC